MKQNEYEALIAQNTEKIQKKETQIKKLQSEIRELKAKNMQMQDDLLLYQVKNQIAGKDITKLIMISQLIDERERKYSILISAVKSIQTEKQPEKL